MLKFYLKGNIIVLSKRHYRLKFDLRVKVFLVEGGILMNMVLSQFRL